MVHQALPVMTLTKIIKEDNKSIYYPEVYGLANLEIQQEINQAILTLTKSLIETQHSEQGFETFNEMIGLYEIKTNERNILSLTLSNYAISKHAAHGLTIIKSLTFNVQTGITYTLADLFEPNSNYIEVLTEHVKAQIKQRDIPLLVPLTAIKADQDFYIADKSLVIYFQSYEITAGYLGFPMFPISVFDLTNIARENGPIDIMATNQ